MTDMKSYISQSAEETQKIAAEIAANLRAGDVVALTGDLGAGKTAFVRGVAKAFGVSEMVTSPTFTLVNEYYGDLNIYHFDAYRLENGGEAEREWLDEYLFGDGVCLIEWAENIAALLPENHIKIEITADPSKGETYREIKVC